MEEPFKPLSLTIRQLFGNSDALYKVPQYQRPYKWTDEQVEKLWADIYESYENGEENYFLGSIITAKPRDNEKSAYVDVVDGQQRLTTLMILFCVIRDLYPEINKHAAHENHYAVDLDTINASISLHGKSSRLKLYTHLQNQSDFENLILNGDTKTLKKPFKYQIRTEEEPKYKFINTSLLFRSKLEDLGLEQTALFINFLFNRVNIIRIDCTNRDFAIKLFQVLNDRGLDLTAADLIKSFLLEKLYKKYKDDPDTSKLKEDQFIADWREMEQNIKNADINTNDLFIIYEYYLLAQNPKKSLYDQLQDEFEQEDPNKIIDDIKRFARSYTVSIHDENDKTLYAFWYIPWNMYWKSILLTALHTWYPEFEELKTQLRRFYYLYWLAGKTLSQIKQTSFNLIKWVKEKRSMKEIKDELDKKLSADSIITLASRNLISENISSEPWIKPLLLLLEYNVTDNSKPEFIELNEYVHLEHILPVKYEKIEGWSQITKELSSTWLHSAGNLTLLSGSKNIEASNNSFSVKIEVYKGKGKYDEKNEKITGFLITQQIVNDYNQNKYNRHWGKDSMADRWKWFFNEIGEMLQIDFSDAINNPEPEMV